MRKGDRHRGQTTRMGIGVEGQTMRMGDMCGGADHENVGDWCGGADH